MELPTFSDFDIEAQFLQFLRDNDIYPAGNARLILDGQLHRYKLNGDKAGETSGAYCIHTDGLPAGWAEDWHTGNSINWHYDISTLSKGQREYYNSPQVKAKAEAEAKKRDEERKARSAEAADKARIYIETLPYAPETHPYLQAKRVFPYGVKLNGKNLAVPLQDVEGNVKSLQWIEPDGQKRILSGSQPKGLFWSVGLDLLNEHPSLPILLGEGFATMSKVYELTGLPSAAGISCSYIKEAAQALKGKYSNNRIIVMADNDKATELRRGFNPGIERANELVKLELAHDVVFPEFDSPDDGSDWDDFAIKFGDERTAQILSEKIKWACFSEAEKKEFLTRKELGNIIHKLDPTIQLPPQEFIGGLFPRKFVSLLVAPPGTGKTIFMQKFVSDLSIGGSIFDGFAEDEPPRVSLIFAGEAGYELLTRRGASMKWPINSNNVNVLDQYEAEIKDIPIMLDNPEGWLNVLRLVDMYKPDIVFFDTFSSFHEGDENKATEMKPLIKKMATLARDNNIAVVPIHHSRKRLAKDRSLSLNQDDVIGSSIINRLVGLIIGIEPMKEDEKLLLVRPLKSWFSSFMPFTYTLKENLYGGTTVQTDLAPASVNNSKIAVWNYLLMNFASGVWFSRSQIVMSEIEGGITERQVRYILTDFVKNGKLQSRGKNKFQEYSIV